MPCAIITHDPISTLDCDTLESSWSNVVTEPALPVVHGTTLTLYCPEEYTNLGGNTATCLYGQVVPTNGSPKCTSGSILRVLAPSANFQKFKTAKE